MYIVNLCFYYSEVDEHMEASRTSQEPSAVDEPEQPCSDDKQHMSEETPVMDESVPQSEADLQSEGETLLLYLPL